MLIGPASCRWNLVRKSRCGQYLSKQAIRIKRDGTDHLVQLLRGNQGRRLLLAVSVLAAPGIVPADIAPAEEDIVLAADIAPAGNPAEPAAGIAAVAADIVVVDTAADIAAVGTQLDCGFWPRASAPAPPATSAVRSKFKRNGLVRMIPNLPVGAPPAIYKYAALKERLPYRRGSAMKDTSGAPIRINSHLGALTPIG